MFVTCIKDALFPSTDKAVVEVLERLGRQEVVFPDEQTYCGQMALITTRPRSQEICGVFNRCRGS